MSVDDSNSGSSASDPVRLSESPDIPRPRSSSRTAADELGVCPWRSQREDPDSCTRFWDCPNHTLERESPSSGNNDSGDLTGVTLRRGTGDSDQAAHARNLAVARPRLPLRTSFGPRGSASRTSQIVSPVSSPTFVEDFGSRLIQSREDFEAGPSRTGRGDGISVGTPASDWRRRSSYAGPADPVAEGNNPPAARAERAMNRSVRSGPSHPNRSAAMASLPAVSLPRWQPDAEVTYCPICHTQFSFFIRKHHCRFVSSVYI